MSIAVVRRLLRRRLAAGCDAAGIPPQRRQLQGGEFTVPDPLRVYVRETLIPGAEAHAANADVPLADTIGVYQVDVCAPAGDGTADLDAAIEAIRAAFPLGDAGLEAEVWLECTGASPLAITETDRELQCPLSITWRARRAVPRS